MKEVIVSSKRYPDEFKIEAVKQVVDRGYSLADVADRLGMTRPRFAGTFTRLQKQQYDNL